MTLTAKERQAVLDALDSYPAGVPSDAWGCGNMAIPDAEGEYSEPYEFTLSQLKEYG